jgi:predicted membrane protein
VAAFTYSLGKPHPFARWFTDVPPFTDQHPPFAYSPLPSRESLCTFDPSNKFKTIFMEKETSRELLEIHQRNQRRGRLATGLIFIVAGAVILARRAGLDLPGWLFSWQMLLIAIGLVIGFKKNFQVGGWIVPILIGCYFLVDDIFHLGPFRMYIFPIGVMIVGLIIIFKPAGQRREFWNGFRGPRPPAETSENVLNASAIFGSVERRIISKDFKGGEITAVFGGTEIDLSQADIQGTVILDTTQVFGGNKIRVPQHWHVRTEVTAIFGGVEDRRFPSQNIDFEKVLVVKGLALFGGLEIV